MKLKRLFALMAAMAVSATMAISASAAVTNPNTEDTDRYVVKLNEIEGFDVKYNEIYGISFSYTGTPSDDQTNNGAIAWQGEGVSWTQKDFALADAENNTVTFINDEPLFDTAEKSWAQVLVAQWDGEEQMDITIDVINILDKDGNVLASFGDKAEEVTPPAGEGNPPTGATAGLALAGMALAGAAIVATKKSK